MQQPTYALFFRKRGFFPSPLIVYAREELPMLTDTRTLHFYRRQGNLTDDADASKFFGCAGDVHLQKLQVRLLHIGRNGYRHIVSLAPDQVQAPSSKASGNYLGFKVSASKGE